MLRGERDPNYLRWLHTQPCACQPCTGATTIVHAHHATNAPSAPHRKSLGGKRGLSQRPDDRFAFTICWRHHGQFHDGKGPFAGWDNKQRSAWQLEQARIYRERYEEELAERADAGAQPRTSLAPIPSTPKGFDPEIAAAEFCGVYELGPQIRHDLVRLLNVALKAGRAA